MDAVPCVLCNRSVNPTVDMRCNEDGKPVHGECYFNHIIGHSMANLQPFYGNNVETVSTAFHSLPIVPDPKICPPSLARTEC